MRSQIILMPHERQTGGTDLETSGITAAALASRVAGGLDLASQPPPGKRIVRRTSDNAATGLQRVGQVAGLS
jgi:hypothetical protein